MSSVLVAMSGGVDSSVAAALLVEEGHEVVGVTLKLWGGPSDSGCCSVGDVEDARRVAAQLGIDHYVFDLGDEFERRVVDPYVEAYAHAQTPNPCVDCNRHIKFDALLDRADVLGFDRLATGHHARLDHRHGATHPRRGHDPAKDQSYVLATVNRAALDRVELPVGELTKADVRERATRLGLRTADKAESMDTCFVKRGTRPEFVAARSAARAGAVVATDGTHLGDHDGVHAFTIGQRRGLGVATGERAYVVDLDATTATVTIGSRADLMTDHVDVDWLVTPTPASTTTVQTRAHGDPVGAHRDGDRVLFERAVPRVAPGQVVALYDGDVVVGGGVAR